eukprot:gene3188-3992_t
MCLNCIHSLNNRGQLSTFKCTNCKIDVNNFVENLQTPTLLQFYYSQSPNNNKSIHDSNSNATTITTTDNNRKCKIHTNNNYIVICSECDIPICQDCLTDSHNGHKSFKLSFTEFSKYIPVLHQIHKEASTMVKSSLRERKQRVNGELTQFKQHYTEEIEILRNSFKELHQHLSNLELSLEKQLKQHHNNEEFILNSLIQHLTEQEEGIDQFLQFYSQENLSTLDDKSIFDRFKFDILLSISNIKQLVYFNNNNNPHNVSTSTTAEKLKFKNLTMLFDSIKSFDSLVQLEQPEVSSSIITTRKLSSSSSSNSSTSSTSSTTTSASSSSFAKSFSKIQLDSNNNNSNINNKIDNNNEVENSILTHIYYYTYTNNLSNFQLLEFVPITKTIGTLATNIRQSPEDSGIIRNSEYVPDLLYSFQFKYKKSILCLYRMQLAPINPLYPVRLRKQIIRISHDFDLIDHIQTGKYIYIFLSKEDLSCPTILTRFNLITNDWSYLLQDIPAFSTVSYCYDGKKYIYFLVNGDSCYSIDRFDTTNLKLSKLINVVSFDISKICYSENRLYLFGSESTLIHNIEKFTDQLEEQPFELKHPPRDDESTWFSFLDYSKSNDLFLHSKRTGKMFVLDTNNFSWNQCSNTFELPTKSYFFDWKV